MLLLKSERTELFLTMPHQIDFSTLALLTLSHSLKKSCRAWRNIGNIVCLSKRSVFLYLVYICPACLSDPLVSGFLSGPFLKLKVFVKTKIFFVTCRTFFKIFRKNPRYLEKYSRISGNIFRRFYVIFVSRPTRTLRWGIFFLMTCDIKPTKVSGNAVAIFPPKASFRRGCQAIRTRKRWRSWWAILQQVLVSNFSETAANSRYPKR